MRRTLVNNRLFVKQNIAISSVTHGPTSKNADEQGL